MMFLRSIECPGVGSRASLTRLAASAAVAVFCLACEKEAPKPSSQASAPSANRDAPALSASSPSRASPASPTSPAAQAKTLQLAVDDGAAFVAGERHELAAPDLEGRLTVAIRAKVEGTGGVVLNAARSATVRSVTQVVNALRSTKAKSIEVHTARRDRAEAELVLSLDAKPDGCSTVGFIAKDSAITTWPASGATAERFVRGMAGPDITRGSEGIRKRVLSCESPAWFVSADDMVTWGVLFDLTYAVMHPEDAGLPKARSVSLLSKAPVPGRKVGASD